jgi:hypothetical protein
LGSTTESPKTLNRRRAVASQRQMMCCTVSASCPQNLQTGSPSNRPIVRRCVLTGACPVRIATTILSWCLLNLSRSSALFLHGPLIKSLPCLCPGTSNYGLTNNTQHATFFHVYEVSPYQISHIHLQMFTNYRHQTGNLKANVITVAILSFYTSQQYDI